MSGDWVRAAASTFGMGVLLLAIGLAGCVGTASLPRDGLTQALNPASGSKVRSQTPPGSGRSGKTSAVWLSAYQPSSAPTGFYGVCRRHSWACSNRRSGIDGEQALRIASQINVSVNQEIQSATDETNYGVAERWTLPYNGKGDCEDFALLKMKRLIEAGVAPSNLLLAMVAGPMPEPHVVLVLRTSSGDYVLDNLSSGITRWRSSRYTFLKMQNPANRAKWDVILRGPRATRGYV